MASATIESLCCTPTRKLTIEYFYVFHSTGYNIVSILASLFGIVGASYQVFVRGNFIEESSYRNTVLRIRGKAIITWLAIADLLAAIGISVRSSVWLSFGSMKYTKHEIYTTPGFCVLTSAWIHYFYTVTYFWTLIYALDIKLVLKNIKINFLLYHAVCWCVPGFLCCIGLLSLYLPDLNCYNEMVNPVARFLPNYLSTFIPIVIVMIINPILYLNTFSSIENLIIAARGRYTQMERDIINGLKMKFFFINLVFYLCWFPNILNGIILWTSWENIPKIIIFPIWYLIAILNPLQAVFNCFVYKSWSSTPSSYPNVAIKYTDRTLHHPLAGEDFSSEEEQNYSADRRTEAARVFQSPQERTPLLSGDRKPSYAMENVTYQGFSFHTSSHF